MEERSIRDQTEHELKEAKDFAEFIVDTVRESMLVLTPELHVKSANLSFYKTFHVDPATTTGRLIFDLGNGQWNIPRLRTLLEEMLPQNQSFEDFRVEHNFESIGHRIMMLNARRLDDQKMILLAIEDVTERQRTTNELVRLKNNLEERVNERSAQVKELASALTRAEQEERSRIGQILNDDLQQQLYGVRLKIGMVRRALATGDRERLLKELEEEDESLGKALEMTRQLTIDLSPPTLRTDDLAEAVAWTAQRMEAMHGLKVEVSAEGDFRIPETSARGLLYQVVRELLFNVVKHAGVDHASVRLFREDGARIICVSDEGRGFNPAEIEKARTPRTAFGLSTACERLTSFGWQLDVASAPDKGTRVTLRVPDG